MPGHSSFRDLAAWQISMTLVERVYEVSAALLPSEKFELGAQIRRAAVSVPSKVAEGQRRRPAEYRQHLRIALGSLAELETQLDLSAVWALPLRHRETWDLLARCQQLYGC